MKRKKQKSSNLKLAAIFIAVVLGLIIVSVLLKVFLVVKASKFDGLHSFIVSFVETGNTKIVDFNPQSNSFSILNIKDNNIKENLAKYFEVPIDGSIAVNNIRKESVPSLLFRSIFSMQKSLKGLTILDVVRLYIFAKIVPPNNIAERNFSSDLNDAQKSTILSLSFTNPSIYEESQSIEIINAASVLGLGSRLANLISNIGGNVVLVSTADKDSQTSRITYYKNKTYTVKKLSEYLGIPAVESESRGLADVIITIGRDLANSPKF